MIRYELIEKDSEKKTVVKTFSSRKEYSEYIDSLRWPSYEFDWSSGPYLKLRSTDKIYVLMNLKTGSPDIRMRVR